MTNYRMVSEGLHSIEVEGESLPVLRQVPIWEGDHMPSLTEMREVSAVQADVEAQAEHNSMATGDESLEMLKRVLGHEVSIPSHWPIVVQRRRLFKFLGYKSLGQFDASDLFVEKEEDFQLPSYWRHRKQAR